MPDTKSLLKQAEELEAKAKALRLEIEKNNKDNQPIDGVVWFSSCGYCNNNISVKIEWVKRCGYNLMLNGIQIGRVYNIDIEKYTNNHEINYFSTIREAQESLERYFKLRK